MKHPPKWYELGTAAVLLIVVGLPILYLIALGPVVYPKEENGNLAITS